MFTEMTFDRFRDLLPNHHWSGATHSLPNLVLRHGRNGIYEEAQLIDSPIINVGNLSSGIQEWYENEFHPDRRYRFAGHAKILDLYSYGFADLWMESLAPCPWYAGIVRLPGDSGTIITSSTTIYEAPPTKNLILIYADREGGRPIHIEPQHAWQVRLAFHELERIVSLNFLHDPWRCNWDRYSQDLTPTQIDEAVSLPIPGRLPNECFVDI